MKLWKIRADTDDPEFRYENSAQKIVVSEINGLQLTGCHPSQCWLSPWSPIQVLTARDAAWLWWLPQTRSDFVATSDGLLNYKYLTDKMTLNFIDQFIQRKKVSIIKLAPEASCHFISPTFFQRVPSIVIYISTSLNSMRSSSDRFSFKTSTVTYLKFNNLKMKKVNHE